MKTIFFILVLICLNTIAVLGQKDSSKMFERSKGTWSYPVRRCYEVFKYNSEFREIDGGEKWCIFFTDSVCEIRAVFEGRVTTVTEDDDYTLVTKFGDYFILY